MTVAALSVCLLVLLAWWAYEQWRAPYPLPELDNGTDWSAFRLAFDDERASYAILQAAEGQQPEPPELPLADETSADAAYVYGVLTGDAAYLQAAVAFHPGHLGYSTAMRQAMIANDQHEELIAFLQSLLRDSKDFEPEIRLQLALAYVDQLQDPSLGTASLGQLSYQSIEEANVILEQHPHDWMGHFLRGINNLYWPVGLQRIEKSIQDLSYCVAVAKRHADQELVMWPMAYAALGDALVKGGSVEEGFAVWKEGAAAYPEYEPLQERVLAGISQAEELVGDIRGMEQFQRPTPELTDISVIWRQPLAGERP
ncbi:hypothetical protein XYCOK13_42860 [Xylanibacillus composti]|uniref:Tetratricopeptide repeat protein n=2 Tax=Xylanibacillus composti TaxID=1572762 RepID=A0A8J4H5S1_9BACL|nr:hypothetical protein XYCOK13_42860 [Xylanibacillus composti]